MEIIGIFYFEQSFAFPIILLILFQHFESRLMQFHQVILIIISGLLFLAAAIQLFYYLWFYLSVYTYEHPEESAGKQPVSVIICARNEAENLKNFLGSVLEQEYPDYEVIVVNDCSEDNSSDVLGEFLLKYPHLKVSTVNKDPKFTHNKKFAQFIGIKAAKNDILLFTDADCQPASKKWLEGMTSHFSRSTDFVLGYGGYFGKKGLLNRYIHYDTLTIAMQYLGMAIRGVPYMGVGRNLAYRRQLFFDRKGFGSYSHVISGDDDLFVNTNATRVNTTVEFRPEYQTRSVPADSFSQWVKQKKRHLTTAPYYKLRDKIILSAEPASRIIFYGATAVLVSFLFMWQYVLVLFTLRLVCQVIVLTLVQKRLEEKGSTLYSLIFDIFSPFLNTGIFLSNLRKRSSVSQWK